jgi:hypothetical protein
MLLKLLANTFFLEREDENLNLISLHKAGGVSLICGSVFLTAYAILFSVILLVEDTRINFISMVLNPNWIWISFVAFLGVIMMSFGFFAVYSRIHLKAGKVGFLGFLFVELAYIFQACQVSWEICLYPIIAAHQSSAVLFTDLIIFQNTTLATFRILAVSSILIGIVLLSDLLRSQEFPKMGVIFILVGAIAYGLGPLLSLWIVLTGIIINSVGCFIVGINLIRHNKELQDSRINTINA